MTVQAVSIKICNVERLLSRCESILSGKTQFQGREWKLEKYVSALESQIQQLEKFSSVSSDQLNSFRQRTGVLREVLHREEETQMIITSSPHHSFSPSHTPPTSLSLPTHSHHHQLHTSHSPVHGKGNELLMRANSRRETSLREQLFNKTPGGEDSSLRHRGSTTALKEDIDSVVNRHQKIQDEIAEDMIRMAQSLKNNSLVAKEIILGDNKVLEKTTKAADENIHGLDKETGRLKEHTRGCAWGVWLLIAIVFVVFFAMVLLIRIVPKPRS